MPTPTDAADAETLVAYIEQLQTWGNVAAARDEAIRLLATTHDNLTAARAEVNLLRWRADLFKDMSLYARSETDRYVAQIRSMGGQPEPDPEFFAALAEICAALSTPPTAADADGTPPQRDPAGEGVS